MRQYETAFLISPNLTEEETEQVITQMADIVSKNKGKMIKEDRWGKRKLAYPIKKFEEAFYVFFHYEGGPNISSELERRFKQTEAILRYLTLKREIRATAKKRKKMSPKAEERPVALEEEKAEQGEISPEVFSTKETNGEET